MDNEPNTINTVDEYIAAAPEEARPILEKLREIIKNTIPNAEEKIRNGDPFYWKHGDLCGFALSKNHVNFGVFDRIKRDNREEFRALGYGAGKNSFEIKFDQEVPIEKVKELLRNKAKKNDKPQN